MIIVIMLIMICSFCSPMIISITIIIDIITYLMGLLSLPEEFEVLFGFHILILN